MQKDDRLSPKICHACISYLNSWQSFKNRCDAAQKKQRVWAGLPPAESKPLSTGAAILQQRLMQAQSNATTKQQHLASLLSQNRQITLQPILPKTNLLQQQLEKRSQPPPPPPKILRPEQINQSADSSMVSLVTKL